MSVISSVAELFGRNAVPSIESTLGQGGQPARATENIRALLGPNVTVSQQVITNAIGRVQQAMQRGQALERGESIVPQQIPVDPTIPLDASYRYRIQVTLERPPTIIPGRPDEVTKVISID